MGANHAEITRFTRGYTIILSNICWRKTSGCSRQNDEEVNDEAQDVCKVRFPRPLVMYQFLNVMFYLLQGTKFLNVRAGRADISKRRIS
jgi:hypothetical protein